MEQAIEYFSIFGGMGQNVELDYFDSTISMVESNFVENFSKFKSLISPSYLLETPYKEILIAVARGDGKIYSVLRKARLNESIGEKIVEELVQLRILNIEFSREGPLRQHPKHKLKKEERSYRIQDKLRFVHPFLRFWFGFVAPYEKELSSGKKEKFLANFEQHCERLYSLVYEQLCDAFLVQYFEETTPLMSHGSFWNIHSEFDILALTSDKRIVLGECKYKDRKVCKNELTKLKAKALESRIKVDIYVLFAKSGFSNELLQLGEKDLLLFDLNDLKRLTL